jgi:small subunit ribosomal protein S17
MTERHLKTLLGRVVSNKMKKTITVEVERTTSHPVYKRVIRKKKTYKAHDETNIAKVGDAVIIAATRPLSKTKRWRLVEVLK